MKGLIRNNFYSVEGSLKATILIGFIAMLVLAVAGIYFPNIDIFAASIIGGILGAFGALAGTAMQKDGTSKWNKFELTMPVSRGDVIKARYISFALYILIGAFMAILTALLFYLVNGSVNLERTGYSFAFGISFAMSIPTFMMPLILIFGIDKNEMLLMISAVVGLGLFFVSSAIVTPFLKNFSNVNFVFRVGYVLFSIVLFAASYLLSVSLYKRKEL